jgi:hypothetical protein
MKICELVNLEQDQWQNLMKKSNYPILMHLPEFLDYHQSKFKWNHLYILNNENELLGYLPCAKEEDKISSCPGISFGGLTTFNQSYEFYMSAYEELLRWAERKLINKIEINLPPNIYKLNNHQLEEYVLYKLGFNLSNIKLSNIIETKNYPDYAKKVFNRNVNNANKNGIIIEFFNMPDLDLIYKILAKNKIKYNTVPTHTLDELKYLLTKFSDRIYFFVAKSKQNQIIGGHLLMEITPNVILVFYIFTDKDYEYLRTSEYLTHHTINYAKKKGFEFVDFGVSDNVFENRISQNLVKFKEKSGSLGLMRTKWIYEK